MPTGGAIIEARGESDGTLTRPEIPIYSAFGERPWTTRRGEGVASSPIR
jgi:hypothetical protein